MDFKPKDISDFSTIIQAIVAIILLIVTWNLMCVSNEIADKSNILIEKFQNDSNELENKIRKSEIEPILRIPSKRYLTNDAKFDKISITVVNIGNRLAKDINILIKENSQFNNYIYNNFYPIGTNFPFYILPTTTFAPIKPDKSIYGKSYLLPNEELEFQYGPMEFNKNRVAITLTFYCSYYDSDNYEYLTITSQVPGRDNMDVIFTTGSKLIDSLNRIPLLELYKYNTFNSINLRGENEVLTSEFFDSLLLEKNIDIK